MSVLIDTSVWVDHFRRRNENLVDVIGSDQGLVHPMVVAELACGTPPAPRAHTLANIGMLQRCIEASLTETTAFIEREELFGKGCGVVDLILLASTLVTPGARLWTLDRRLAGLAERYSVNYRPLNAAV